MAHSLSPVPISVAPQHSPSTVSAASAARLEPRESAEELDLSPASSEEALEGTVK